jgi:hypothetical protein
MPFDGLRRARWGVPRQYWLEQLSQSATGHRIISLLITLTDSNRLVLGLVQ